MARQGLSFVELEDMISFNESIIAETYPISLLLYAQTIFTHARNQYWAVPDRRPPPSMLIRIIADIEEFIVNSGSAGVPVYLCRKCEGGQGCFWVKNGFDMLVV